jgi:hypothetical protein
VPLALAFSVGDFAREALQLHPISGSLVELSGVPLRAPVAGLHPFDFPAVNVGGRMLLQFRGALSGLVLIGEQLSEPQVSEPAAVH